MLAGSLCSAVWANPVKQLFQKGAQAYQQQNYREAIRLFESAIKIYPDLAPAYNYLGLCHKSLNANVYKVIDYFEKAVEIDPEYILAYDNLAKIYYGLNKYEQAEKYNLKALELKPDLLSSLLSLGWINLLGKSDQEEAIYYFEQVVEQSDMPYAYFGLGLANFLDQNNAEVLHVITVLRRAGEEDLAKHLEVMLRENRYIAPNSPRPPSKQAPSTSKTKHSASASSDSSTSSSVAGMKVRLRKK